MGAFSNDMEAKIIEHFLRNNAQTSPVAVYLALFESDPGEDASGTETFYTDYVRQVSTWTALNGSGQTKNVGSITFPANGNVADPVTITHAAIYDTLILGNILIYGALAAPKILEITDVLSFAGNSLVLTLD